MGPKPHINRKPRPKSGSFPAVPLFRRPLFPGVIAPIVVQDTAACEAFVKMQDTGVREAGLFLHKAVGKQSFALNETVSKIPLPVATTAWLLKEAGRGR